MTWSDGDVGRVHCSDATLTVLIGPIEVRLGATTVASVPTFGSVRVFDTGGAQLGVENIGPVAIVVDSNGQQTVVGPGGSFRGDPVAATEQLIAAVRALNLQAGVARSLVSKLEGIVAKLGVGPTPFRVAANALGAFINAVEAQRGKKIARADADALIAAAERLIADLRVR